MLVTFRCAHLMFKVWNWIIWTKFCTISSVLRLGAGFIKSTNLHKHRKCRQYSEQWYEWWIADFKGGKREEGKLCTLKELAIFVVDKFLWSQYWRCLQFYPHNPPAMGSIFFHEVAHLIGVPHRNATETIDVPNCYCNEISADKKPTGPTGCLKIP